LFMNIMPSRAKYEPSLLLPTLHGGRIALPVPAFAILIVVSTRAGRWAFDRITPLELWAGYVPGVILIDIGVYFPLAYVVDVW